MRKEQWEGEKEENDFAQTGHPCPESKITEKIEKTAKEHDSEWNTGRRGKGKSCL